MSVLRRLNLAVAACASVLLLGAPAALGSGAVHEPSGGAGLGALAPRSHVPRIPPPPAKGDHGVWLHGVSVTEYWPAPESWFVGALVSAPGLPGKHRIDWLYSASGISMQGEGLGLDGRMYHIDALGRGGWVTASGQPTSPANGWAGGAPFWRAGAFWKSLTGAVTFPLGAGGWYAGTGHRYVSLPGVSFAPGASLPLTFYGSIAVDPRVIPLGSRVYIPAYRKDGHGGWFIAQDTGGGILGRHVDVYRTPPARPDEGGQFLTAQRIFVIASHS